MNHLTPEQISQALELRDTGKPTNEIVASFPAVLHSEIGEYFEILNWIDSEAEKISVPAASLQNILSHMQVEAPIAALAKSPVPVSAPKAFSTASASVLDRAPATRGTLSKAPMPTVNEMLPKKSPSPAADLRSSSWFGFLNHARWKIWLPAGAVALFALIFGISRFGGTTAVSPSPSTFAVNSENTAPSASKAALAPSPAADVGQIKNVDDAVAALAKGSNNESDIISGSDPDYAAADPTPLSQMNSAYNENTI